MSLISLHRKYSFIDYQNHLCSKAAFITLIVILASIILPFVWMFKVNNDNFSASDHIMVYEQPMIKFQFKYIVVMEHAMEATEKVILCSLFDRLKEQEEKSNCAKVKIMEKDVNFDGIPDEIHFTLGFETMFGYGVKSLSLLMLLDARLKHQCNLSIPSAVIINKMFPNNLSNRNIVITGSLQNQQNQALVCPFFLRNVKSHFFNVNLANNETSLDKLSISRNKDNLERNPMHFHFQESSTDYKDPETELSFITIQLRIPEVLVRYKKTFWKALNDFWINYVAIFIVTFVICNFLLTHLFESRILMARKKSSLKNKET